METLNEKLEKYNNHHTRNALLWWWVFAFCVFAFLLSLQWPTIAFAWFPIAAFALASLFTSCYEAWEAIKLFRENQYVDGGESETAEEYETQIASEVQVNEVPTQSRYKTTLESCENTLFFLYQLTKDYTQDKTALAPGEPQFKNKKIYQLAIPFCVSAGIVSQVPAGGRRKILLSFDAAVAAFGNKWSELYARDYWQPLKEAYQTENIAPLFRNNRLKGYFSLKIASEEVRGEV